MTNAMRVQNLGPLQRSQIYRNVATGEGAQAKGQMEQHQLAAQQQALDWLDKDPAAQKMDPQQRMVLRSAIASGHIQPGMLGETPYQKGLLDIKKQELGLAGQKTAAEIAQKQALTGTYASLGGGRSASQDVASFELLLNAPSDIAVLARPPWWTPSPR